MQKYEGRSEQTVSRLDAVIAKFVRAAEEGAPPDRESFLAEHTELAEGLREFFKNRDHMDELLRPVHSMAARVLNIRCPHCHNSVELLDDERISNISCPSCGSSFSLVGTSTDRPLGLDRIGRFELLEQVGMGQFGTVWKAQDLTLQRTVAIKIPRQRQLSEAETEVFVRDARVSAQLNHPNIVSVHEVGKHDDTTYIVSDYIEGASLKEWAATTPLTPQEAARLCVTVGKALHDAHESGVVHRDLKPGNIMMDLNGRPHIVDFGLAKRDAEEITMTIEGEILGTPAYMPPEQACGGAHHVDCKADIYSLGVILFELLTGELPFRGHKQMLLVQIQNDPAPSPRRLNDKIPRALETICLKCLEKEPHRRYESAQAFADDCERFLNGAPVQARPVSRLARGWRWSRRNPLVAGLAAAVIALLVGIAVTSSIGFFQTQAALDVAQQRADTIEQNLYYSEMNRAGHSARGPDGLAQVAGLLEKWLPENTRVDRRGWEWYYLDSLLHQDLATLSDHEGGVFSLAWSPDGSHLASASGDQTVKIWASDGQVTHTLTGHNAQVNSVQWNKDGSLLASASFDGTVRIWDVAIGEVVQTLRHEGPVDAAMWSHDGYRLATVSFRNPSPTEPTSIVTIWSSSAWKKEKEFHPTPTRTEYLSWNPRRSQIAVGSRYGQVTIWDAATGEERHGVVGGFVAWNHDGTRLAVGCEADMSVWDIHEKEQVAKAATFYANSYVTCGAWSPNGSVLAYAAGHKAVRLCDVATETELLSLRGHVNRVTAICWHPKGHRIATASNEGTIKVWNTAISPRFSSGDGAVSWNPDGSRYASRIGKSVVINDVRTTKEVKRFDGHARDVFAVSWSPDGASVASSSYDGEVRIWDATTGEVKCSFKTRLSDLGTRLPTVLTWSPDSRRLAFPQTDCAIRIVDVTTEERTHDLHGHTKPLRSLAWSADGTRIVSGGDDEILCLWNALTGQLEQTLGSSYALSEISAVCWNPDDSRIASANADTNVYIWDAETGRQLQQLCGHTNYVHTVSWSCDGLRIASADQSGSIRIWDARTGQQTLTLSYPGGVPMVAWNPDGKSLAAVTFRGTAAVRIWDVAVDRPEGINW